MSSRCYRINRDLPDGATAFLRTALEDYGWQRTDGKRLEFRLVIRHARPLRLCGLTT